MNIHFLSIVAYTLDQTFEIIGELNLWEAYRKAMASLEAAGFDLGSCLVCQVKGQKHQEEIVRIISEAFVVTSDKVSIPERCGAKGISAEAYVRGMIRRKLREEIPWTD